MKHPLRRSATLLLLVSSLACATASLERDALSRDLLTDVVDDGSLFNGALSADAETRELAVRALANLPPIPPNDLLINRAEIERDSEVIKAFCFLFGRWKHEPGLRVLESYSAHPRPGVRAAAFDALGRFESDGQTSRLLVGLADEAAEVRVAACDALARVDANNADHPRRASEDELLARDTSLAETALRDPDPLVRWHAVWALGRVRARPGHATVFRQALPDRDPLVRLFAVRGLARDAGADSALLIAGLDDPDPRVALESAAMLARSAPLAGIDRRLGHPRPMVRQLAVEGLRRGDAELPERLIHELERLKRDDPSPAVAREARATLAARGAEAAPAARDELLQSPDPRDRERLARLLADGELNAPRLLDELLADLNPSVRAAAVSALRHEDLRERRAELIDALNSSDVAVRGSAAEACAPVMRSGNAPPWLVSALADSLSEPLDPSMEEARVSLAGALGLPALDPAPPSVTPEGALLERLQAERAAALADRFVHVELSTSRGDVLLELDRTLAPRHVASLLELAGAQFYDGLDIHRVVPNFVVQGLDPRGDGWGTGGRRLPDEFTPTPVVAGIVGMPRTGTRHTGGCQLFITQIPAPHLTGDYTVLGRVLDGMSVVEQLEIGDTILSVRRVVNT
ncbi:MAG: hypothetical protein DHS20C15_17760 [Planctomycetota bacterium]|nr:MAG: hypothetical protein DHS20C15_17760 [Planctomycetota bacterium]